MLEIRYSFVRLGSLNFYLYNWHWICCYVLENHIAVPSSESRVMLGNQNIFRSPSLQERIQLETARLYKLAGINPLAGTTSIVTPLQLSDSIEETQK